MTRSRAERVRAAQIARLNDRARQAMGIAEPDPAQIVMPGVQPVSLGERLQWQAQLPMQPRRAQKPLDVGFWDPMHEQLEMF